MRFTLDGLPVYFPYEVSRKASLPPSCSQSRTDAGGRRSISTQNSTSTCWSSSARWMPRGTACSRWAPAASRLSWSWRGVRAGFRSADAHRHRQDHHAALPHHLLPAAARGDRCGPERCCATWVRARRPPTRPARLALQPCGHTRRQARVLHAHGAGDGEGAGRAAGAVRLPGQVLPGGRAAAAPDPGPGAQLAQEPVHTPQRGRCTAHPSSPTQGAQLRHHLSLSGSLLARQPLPAQARRRAATQLLACQPAALLTSWAAPPQTRARGRAWTPSAAA